MSDLRERIAAAVVEKLSKRRDGRVEFSPYDVADAVIADLSLDKEFGCPVAGHHFCRCSHRHTTKWESNDDD